MPLTSSNSDLEEKELLNIVGKKDDARIYASQLIRYDDDGNEIQQSYSIISLLKGVLQQTLSVGQIDNIVQPIIQLASDFRNTWQNGNHALQVVPKPDFNLKDYSGITGGANENGVIAPQQAGRRYFFIQNLSEAALWINFDQPASQGLGSIKLNPSDSFTMEDSVIIQQAINVIGSQAGQMYTCKIIAPQELL